MSAFIGACVLAILLVECFIKASAEEQCKSDRYKLKCIGSDDCFSTWEWCDRWEDCPNGYDEQHCPDRCPRTTRMILCPGTSDECFYPAGKCNEENDCTDGYDESGCPVVEPWEPSDMTWLWVLLGLFGIGINVCVIGCICYCRYKQNASVREQAQVSAQYRQNMPGGGSHVVVGGYMPTPAVSDDSQPRGYSGYAASAPPAYEDVAYYK